jgi:hypothetical protein
VTDSDEEGFINTLTDKKGKLGSEIAHNAGFTNLNRTILRSKVEKLWVLI